MKYLDLAGLRRVWAGITRRIDNSIEEAIRVTREDMERVHDIIDDTKQDRTQRPVVLQRGIISTRARRGVVYRNLGWIRIPLHWKDNREKWDDGTYYNGVVSIDGVDLSIVTGVEVVDSFHPSGLFADEFVRLDRFNKIVLFRLKRDQRHPKYLSLRLKVEGENPHNGERRYLMRERDGIIRAKGVSFNVVEPAIPAAPKIPMTSLGIKAFKSDKTPLLGQALYGLLGTYNLEVQIKKRQSFDRWNNRKRKVKWRGRCRKCGYDIKGLWRATRGVARVRYPKRGRHPASPWTVFTFKFNGRESVLIQRLG